MLGLSVDMALLYRKSARAMSTSSTTVNFNLTFGHQMSSFVEHKDLIAELMWTWQLNNSPEITGTFDLLSFEKLLNDLSLLFPFSFVSLLTKRVFMAGVSVNNACIIVHPAVRSSCQPDLNLAGITPA